VHDAVIMMGYMVLSDGHGYVLAGVAQVRQQSEQSDTICL